MKKSLLIASIVILLSAMQTQAAKPTEDSWKVYKGPEMGFEMPYSTEWKAQDNNMKTAAPWVVYKIPAKSKQDAVVSVLKLHLSGISFDTVIAEEKKLKTTTDIQKTTVGGREAHQVTTSEPQFKKVSYLISDGESFWRIDFGSSPKEWESFKPAFDRVLAGFKFVPPVLPAAPKQPKTKKGKK
jgi:hypothetical protein